MSAKNTAKKVSKPAKKAKKSTSKKAEKSNSKSKYHCCVCDEEMTAQVETACTTGPETRAMLVDLEGKNLVHSSPTVQLTCPNGHTRNYTCRQGSDVEP
jgi:hypothetical protein